MSKELTLLVGATGFLGGAIAVLLDPKKTLYLVRAENKTKALSRICHNLAKFEVWKNIPSEHILPYSLETIKKHKDLKNVVSVINVSGNTSFSDNLDIWTTNVTDTIIFAKFIKENCPNLKEFVQIGTAYDYSDATLYTQSKREQLRQLKELDLPLTILKPTIIIGHTKLGCKPSSSIFWILEAALGTNAFESLKGKHCDVIAVDEVADIIVSERYNKFEEGYISAGNNTTTIDKILEVYAKHKEVKEFDLETKKILEKGINLYGYFINEDKYFSHDGPFAETKTCFLDYMPTCIASLKEMNIIQMKEYDFQ